MLLQLLKLLLLAWLCPLSVCDGFVVGCVCRGRELWVRFCVHARIFRWEFSHSHTHAHARATQSPESTATHTSTHTQRPRSMRAGLAHSIGLFVCGIGAGANCSRFAHSSPACVNTSCKLLCSHSLAGHKHPHDAHTYAHANIPNENRNSVGGRERENVRLLIARSRLSVWVSFSMHIFGSDKIIHARICLLVLVRWCVHVLHSRHHFVANQKSHRMDKRL